MDQNWIKSGINGSRGIEISGKGSKLVLIVTQKKKCIITSRKGSKRVLIGQNGLKGIIIGQKGSNQSKWV